MLLLCLVTIEDLIFQLFDNSNGSRNGGVVSVAGTPNRFNSNLRPSAPMVPAVASAMYEQQLPLNPTAYIEVIHEDEVPKVDQPTVFCFAPSYVCIITNTCNLN